VGKPDLDIAPRQCADSLVALHAQLSGKTSDIPCVPFTLFSRLSESRLFPASQLKTTLKGRRFQTTEEMSLIRRTDCARAQFSGCSSTSNTHSEMRQMAVCCQNLTVGTLSKRSELSMLVGMLFKKFGIFLNSRLIL